MASANQRKWLNTQIDLWTGRGIIDNSQAQSIRLLYPASQSLPPWALMVFCGIGAIIIGLGVILLFAYNWHVMSKFAKLGVIFTALAAFHIAGYSFFTYSIRLKGLGDAISVLGTMLYGAAIWLIAQIYHISEHYPSAFLFWALGAFALAFTMPSTAQSMVAAILFAIWAAAEAAGFETAKFAAIVFLLLIGLQAYRRRSVVLMGVAAAAMMVACGFISSAGCGGEIVFTALLGVCAACIAAGFLAELYGSFPAAGPGLKTLGLAGYLVVLFILSFSPVTEEVYIHSHEEIYGRFVGMFFVLAAAATWAVVLLRVGSDKPVRQATDEDVHILQPGEIYAFTIDFNDPAWFVQNKDGKPKSVREIMSGESYRFVYQPPSPQQCEVLKNADLIWHGRLATRAFSSDRID